MILLELQFLLEAGRIRIRAAGIAELADDERWTIDEPPATTWFQTACDLAWTRDPFDRLLVAHAQVRGWKLATGDAALLQALPASQTVAL